ncbi:hypothetical protein [Actinophytocola sp.]|uniref:hypothetical protein n=1 Tax=Actinophytocola sp. TaxID=1872138 RepID=UPI002ECFE687
MTSTEPWPLDNLPLVGGPDFPIGIFWPPHPYATNPQRYQEIADAGMTFLITGNYMFDQHINRRALALAGQVGLKVLVGAPEPRLSAITHTLSVTDDSSVPLRISTVDTRRLVQQMLDEYRPFPAFAGFDVFDEPAPPKFPTVGAVTAAIRDLGPTLLPYSNLVPGNGSGYQAFVQSFLDTVRPPVLSFDRYPILSSGLDINYFDNWAIIRRLGLAAGIPTWVYIQSVKFSGRVIPNEAQLRWQINMSLAYGAKGILYFTWWTPEVARGEEFESAIIALDGQRTPLYDAARRVNLNWLRPIGRELKPLVSVSVTHANDTPLPPGTEAFQPDEYISRVEGGPVVLGQFRAEPDDGSRWVLVVNRSDRNDTTVRIVLGSSAKKAEEFRANPRRDFVVIPGPVSTQLSAGGAILLRIARN